MNFCKKCHKRILDNEKFVGPRNYVWVDDKFCKCNIHVVGNDDGPKVIVQHNRGRERAYG